MLHLDYYVPRISDSLKIIALVGKDGNELISQLALFFGAVTLARLGLNRPPCSVSIVSGQNSVFDQKGVDNEIHFTLAVTTIEKYFCLRGDTVPLPLLTSTQRLQSLLSLYLNSFDDLVANADVLHRVYSARLSFEGRGDIYALEIAPFGSVNPRPALAPAVAPVVPQVARPALAPAVAIVVPKVAASVAPVVAALPVSQVAPPVVQEVAAPKKDVAPMASRLLVSSSDLKSDVRPRLARATDFKWYIIEQSQSQWETSKEENGYWWLTKAAMVKMGKKYGTYLVNHYNCRRQFYLDAVEAHDMQRRRFPDMEVHVFPPARDGEAFEKYQDIRGSFYSRLRVELYKKFNRRDNGADEDDDDDTIDDDDADDENEDDDFETETSAKKRAAAAANEEWVPAKRVRKQSSRK
jgi:hypothetical protein